MYSIKKSFRFEAAHRLPHHEGKCQRLHGHSFVGTVYLRGEDLQRTGPDCNMLVDFGDVGAAVAVMSASFLDHHYLNESLAEESPTAEFIARWCFERLTRDTRFGQLVHAVEIAETCTASAIYARSLAS